jgi:2-polyprenyl-3-methyl-5-hydroxy-6-metoxy-1,4-benzoquinol methylase
MQKNNTAPVCPLDGKPMRLWHQVPFDGKTGHPNRFSDVFRCDSCQYGSVYPLPQPTDVPDFYRIEKYYTHGDSHFDDPGSTSLMDRIRMHLAWRLDHGKPRSAAWIRSILPTSARTVCDIGCGSGALAAALADMGYIVTGVEPDPQTLAHVIRDKIEVVAASAENCTEPLAGRHFDAILMSHVLEHCIDPARALTCARELLSPDGVLICEVPNNAAAALGFSGTAWEMFDVPRHLHFFNEYNLRKFCERTGLRVDTVVYSEYCRQFSNSWIATERSTWDRVTGFGASAVQDRPVPNSKLRAWLLFMSTLLAADRLKYDSVRIIASAA